MEEKKIPEGIEVDKPVIQEGKAAINFSGPPPKKLKMVCEGIIYFCAGLGGVVGATDLFTGYQAKVIALVLSCVILACGGIMKAIGVEAK